MTIEPNTNPMRINCCPVRSYAVPAPHVECVYVAERATRTAVVLGISVEIPMPEAK